MWIADKWNDFELIDCSDGEKLERWGQYYLVRPDPQAIWLTPRTNEHWLNSNARYHRSESGGGSWNKGRLPESWKISYGNLTFLVKPMNFKHTGLFPEQASNWDYCGNLIEKAKAQGKKDIKILNLFAYTGGATVASAAHGADETVHVDASKGMIMRAKENIKESGLSDSYVRFIAEDCMSFVDREIRRGRKYDGIIMDPPSYGRGPSGEMWKLEECADACEHVADTVEAVVMKNT